MNFRLPLHERDCSGKSTGCKQVVRAEDKKIIRARPVDPLVERGVLAEVAPVRHHLHPPVLSGELLRHFHAVVGGGVVDDENTDAANALAQDARNAIAQETPILVAGDCDVEAGRESIRSALRHSLLRLLGRLHDLQRSNLRSPKLFPAAHLEMNPGRASPAAAVQRR
jgi:hypothetical protein